MPLGTFWGKGKGGKSDVLPSPVTLASTSCTQMAPAKAIPGNSWLYRNGKGLLGAPWERWSRRDRGFWHLTPLGCPPSTSLHPWGSASSLCLPQGASGACFPHKALWDLLLKELAVTPSSYQGFFHRALRDECAEPCVPGRAWQGPAPLCRVSTMLCALRAPSGRSSCAAGMIRGGWRQPGQLVAMPGSSPVLDLKEWVWAGATWAEARTSPGWQEGSRFP